jgi:hypothetical protein
MRARHLTLGTLALVGALLGTAALPSVSSVVRYGAWLTAFAVWMAWFVVVARKWLSRADF